MTPASGESAVAEAPVPDAFVGNAPLSAFELIDDDTDPAVAIQDEAAIGFDDSVAKHLLEEEKKLEEERAQHEKEEAEEIQEVGTSGGSQVPQGDVGSGSGVRALGNSSYEKLHQLLDRASHFTQFILENMDDISMMPKSTMEASAPQEEEEKGKGKRKAGGKGRGRGGKKKKKAEGPSLASKILTAEERSGLQGTDDTYSEAENEEEQEKAQKLLLKEQNHIAPNLENCILKPYQLKGLKWLISLWQNGLNGILADQMGLGKTVQTISLLAHLKSRGMHGPYLVVAPLSTLSNWINEFNRFLPSAKVLLYHGSREEREVLRAQFLGKPTNQDYPIIVTSFEVVMNDRKRFQSTRWSYLIVDEGHRLKNSNCKLIKELRQMNIENTLLLTGTPLQNNLTELWSLLNFLLPTIFTSLEEFTAWFDLDGKQSSDASNQGLLDAERRAQVVAKLHHILRPFLLRRIKADVEKSLPKKKEIILYAQLTPEQKDFQEKLISKTLHSFLHSTLAMAGISRKSLNNVTMQLRKNCNHPDMLRSPYEVSSLYPPVEELLEQCGKLKLMDRLLTKLRAKGHKVLIFSQMTKLLDILDYYLDERGFRACRIDGSVKLEDRRSQIKEFNDPDSDLCVFLLSTRAGGLGINLTAADTVIIYDSDWNPHMDMQAMDRCHRIGQTKPVHVYRLCTAHSIECRMLEVAGKKLKLETMVIEKGQFIQERQAALKQTSIIDTAEVEALLRPKQSEHQEMVQKEEISEENLNLLLDRSDMLPGGKASKNGDGASTPSGKVLPLGGPGWEVVVPGVSQGSLLSGIA